MVVRTAQAIWEGRTESGKGLLRLGSGAYEGTFGSDSMLEEHEPQISAEELFAAAHATAFSVEISSLLERSGHPAIHISTYVRVHVEGSGQQRRLSEIDIEVEAKIPGLSESRFHELAAEARQKCPLLLAIETVPLRLRPRLVS